MTGPGRTVPQGRVARLAVFGQLAGGVAAGMLGEGMRRLARGERPHLQDLLMTPGNALRVTDQLSRLRGAAMKLGQMLSLDAGEVLPPELADILARLRDAAHVMPPDQLNRVLAAQWGADWRRRFTRFDARPLAAASIGQVHRAVLPDGRDMAVKVQYPGVAASIDADIDNVVTLLRLSGQVPEGLDLGAVLAEAKRQLHEEADYAREATQLAQFGVLLAGDGRFVVPGVQADLLRPGILAMDYVEGSAIEALVDAPQALRDRVMTDLLDLVLRELFEFGLMQTDPNFANYRWQASTKRIVLLDFGAARPVSAGLAAGYRALMQTSLSGDRAALSRVLGDMGFVSPALQARHGATMEAMTETLLRRLEGDAGLFDFADRAVMTALRDQAGPILADRAAWHVPPPEALFVQRKIGGIALLGLRLRARVPLAALLARYAG